MKLLLDEHYANDIAAALREAGHDAVTVSERGLKGLGDGPLLALAASEDRALLTNNARDFLPLIRRWAESGDTHGGLLLTSDSSLPRGKRTIGLYVERLSELMEANPDRRALANQVRWLDRALARRAAEEGLTKAEFIRRGLARLVDRSERPRPTAVGFADDGPTDLAANVDRYLREGGFGER